MGSSGISENLIKLFLLNIKKFEIKNNQVTPIILLNFPKRLNNFLISYTGMVKDKWKDIQ